MKKNMERFISKDNKKDNIFKNSNKFIQYALSLIAITTILFSILGGFIVYNYLSQIDKLSIFPDVFVLSSNFFSIIIPLIIYAVLLILFWGIHYSYALILRDLYEKANVPLKKAKSHFFTISNSLHIILVLFCFVIYSSNNAFINILICLSFSITVFYISTKLSVYISEISLDLKKRKNDICLLSKETLFAICYVFFTSF